MDLNNSVLIDILEYVWRIEEDGERPGGCDEEKYVQLQPVDDHRHILPVFADLRDRINI